VIISAGRNETFPFARAIGIGLIESSINLAKICLLDKPKKLLFIGSAGSYGNFKIFDIVKSKKASNIELSFLTQSAYTPLDNIIKNDNNFVKSNIIVNSSNYISTDKKLTKEFLKLGVDIENMEFFSVLSVAKEFNISASGIFIITNYTNKNAHKDFIKNHKIAMDKLTNYLIQKNIAKMNTEN